MRRSNKQNRLFKRCMKLSRRNPEHFWFRLARVPALAGILGNWYTDCHGKLDRYNSVEAFARERNERAFEEMLSVCQ